MQNTYNGGFLLAVAVFLVILLLFFLINWRPSILLLFERGINKKPIGASLAATLSRLKITLLYFSGASKGDLREDALGYLSASHIGETYFFQNKLRCIWQLFSYYMFYSMLLVFLAKPIDPSASEMTGRLISYTVSKNAPVQVLNLVLLSATNVVTDFLSLTVTFVLLGKMIDALRGKSYAKMLFLAATDLLFAAFLFSLSQLVSNLLYPIAITNPPADYNPYSVSAMMMPYAFLREVDGSVTTFFNFTFPGQVFITGTVFVPTLVSLALVILSSVLLFFGDLVKKMQAVVLGVDDLAASLAPEPLVGDARSPQIRRQIRCFSFAVHTMLTILTGATASIIAAIFTYLFLQSS